VVDALTVAAVVVTPVVVEATAAVVVSLLTLQHRSFTLT